MSSVPRPTLRGDLDQPVLPCADYDVEVVCDVEEEDADLEVVAKVEDSEAEPEVEVECQVIDDEEPDLRFECQVMDDDESEPVSRTI